MFGRPQIPEEHRLPELPIGEVPRRTAAYLLDVFLCALVLMSVQGAVFVLVFGGERAPWLDTGPRIWAFEWATISLPVWLYFTFSESGRRGATIGKRLLRLRVSTAVGAPISRGRAFVRTVLKLLPWELTHVAILLPTPLYDAGPGETTRPLLIVSTVMFGAWFGAVLLMPKAQGVHDLLAGTLVLDAREPARDGVEATDEDV